MKTLTKLLLLALLVFCCVGITLAAAFQGEPDPNWLDVLATFAINLAGFAAAIVVTSEWLIGRIFRWDGIAAWVGTLLVGEFFAYLGWFFKAGMFAELTQWWHVALVGCGGSLAANGIFSIDFVRMFLAAIGIRLPEAQRR